MFSLCVNSLSCWPFPFPISSFSSYFCLYYLHGTICVSLRLDSRGAREPAARAQEETEDARVRSGEARVLPETASPQCALCSLQWGECTVSVRCIVNLQRFLAVVPNYRAVHCLRHFCTQDTVTHLLLVGFEVFTPVVIFRDITPCGFLFRPQVMSLV
jgi:hypothetical protein